MSPAPPTPEWPISSSVGVGIWNDDTKTFSLSSSYPVSFQKEQEGYVVNAKLPNNTTDDAFSLALPSGFEVDSISDNTNFEGVYDSNTYVVWKSNTAMQDIAGTVVVSLSSGGVININYSFE